MASTKARNGGPLVELRAKAALFDELVEQLARTEDELERLRAELIATRRAAARDGIDPAWREIANALAGALRPYSMFREQTVEDGRIGVHTRVPGSTLRTARQALELIGRQVATESHREHGIPVREDQQRSAEEAAREQREAARELGARPCGPRLPPMVARPGGRAAAWAAAPHGAGPDH